MSIVTVVMFLRLPTPPGKLREKLSRMDWMYDLDMLLIIHILIPDGFFFSFCKYRGNSIIISSTTGIVIGLTWGGVRYSWSSAAVLVPLIVGVCGLFVFFLYEARFAKNPIVSAYLLAHRRCTHRLSPDSIHDNLKSNKPQRVCATILASRYPGDQLTR